MSACDSEGDMGRTPYSVDLRRLVVGEVAAGASRRAAARRFKVSPSSAIRWVERQARTGSVAAKRPSGSRSPLEAHAEWLLDVIKGEPDLTLAAIVARLASERGMGTSDSSVDRFFKRRGISFKKKPARRRAGPARRGRGAPSLEGRPSQP
jgi:transposase